MPKLHFGSRGGVYTIKNGNKNYLKFGNDSDSDDEGINFNNGAFGNEGEGQGQSDLYKLYSDRNDDIAKLDNVIDNINDINGYGYINCYGYTKDNEEELFHNILRYPKPNPKSNNKNHYKNLINENNLYNLRYLAFNNDDIDYYYGKIMIIVNNNHISFEPKRLNLNQDV